MSGVVIRKTNVFVAALVALLLITGFAACGGGGNSIAALDGSDGEAIVLDPANGDVVLTIGSNRSAARRILAQIYAQALRAAGYEVRKGIRFASGIDGREALKSGDISGFAEPLGTVLASWYGFRLLQVRGKPRWTMKQVQPELAAEGLTAFPPTPFAQGYILAALRKPAEKHEWRNLFALEYRVEHLVIAGPPECRMRSDCLVGLRKKYALNFKSYVVAPLERGLDMLDSGRADFAFVATTDPRLRLERDKFDVLPDSKRVIAAANLVFVTSRKLAREAGPDYRRTIAAVQKGLTAPVIQELLARVELRGESPPKVAALYLEEAGYID